ncbi:hypothetical protein B0H10DRAFT_1959251 [Mycena sp. CBHHK59/15]|nr:hypothetical protein B0H10DRAFT_1959251 [Mycena sp. CBHHK59/15]
MASASYVYDIEGVFFLPPGPSHLLRVVALHKKAVDSKSTPEAFLSYIVFYLLSSRAATQQNRMASHRIAGHLAVGARKFLASEAFSAHAGPSSPSTPPSSSLGTMPHSYNLFKPSSCSDLMNFSVLPRPFTHPRKPSCVLFLSETFSTEMVMKDFTTFAAVSCRSMHCVMCLKYNQVAGAQINIFSPNNGPRRPLPPSLQCVMCLKYDRVAVYRQTGRRPVQEGRGGGSGHELSTRLGKVPQVQSHLNGSQRWAYDNGCQTSIPKCLYQIFGRRRKPSEYPVFHLNGKTIARLDKACYLGIWIKSGTKFIWREQYKVKAKKARMAANVILGLLVKS